MLSFAPFVLLETSEFRRLFRERPVRFSLLEPNDLEEIFHRAERLGDRSFGNLSWHSFRFALPDKFFGDLLAGSFFMRGGENREIYRRMKSERGHTFFGIKNGSSEPFKEVVIDDFVASKMLQFYLAEIIGLAEQNQIEVYWYTMPFNASSGAALSASFRSGHDAFLGELSRGAGVTVVNNGITVMDDAEFGDPSHVFGGVQQVTQDLLRGVGLEVDRH